MRKLIRHFFSIYSHVPETYENVSISKYVKSGLTLQEAIEIKEKITVAFEQDKLYKNNDIGLNDLSRHISSDRYKISQVINEYLSKNFYSLLSYYRIEEAKDLLISQPFLSVKTIMYEVGYNSKASFYNFFKKETGLSPNDYRNLAFYAS
ncbi:MAG: helix-turn-helix domain-containing protein [Flavobacteriaceae bacterium]